MIKKNIMMNPKTCNYISIILAILILIIIVRAATNEGRLWGKKEKYGIFDSFFRGVLGAGGEL
jgi:hypothetical protein